MPFATVAELADWIAPAPLPEAPARLLARASRDVAEATVTAVYAVDSTGTATDPRIVDALREATLEQAAYRIELGDESGTGTGAPSGSIGSVKIDAPAASASAGGTLPLGEQAHRVLWLARLTGQPIQGC